MCSMGGHIAWRLGYIGHFSMKSVSAHSELDFMSDVSI